MGAAFFGGLVVLAAGAAAAGSVYVNGVNFDHVTNQEFKNCTVKFDADGNVWIHAKDYLVKMESRDERKEATAAGTEPQGAAVPDLLSMRYWLVSQTGTEGRSGYDVDVFVNGAHVRKALNSEEQVVFDLTPKLRPGKNTVKLAASKARGAIAVAGSKAWTALIIGEGSTGGNSIVIDKPLVEFKRSAAESDPFVSEYTIIAR
jgi:hypothetical protein